MALAPPDIQHLEAATGYAQLGMWLDTDSELDNIDPFNCAAFEVLALRIEIYRGLKKWELMREIAKRLTEFQPANIQWILSYAFASRRALSIEVAKEILLKSVARFPREAVIYFNLACYSCQLGDLKSAKDFLKRAFEIDPNWRFIALDDVDLEPLWKMLAADLQKSQ